MSKLTQGLARLAVILKVPLLENASSIIVAIFCETRGVLSRVISAPVPAPPSCWARSGKIDGMAVCFQVRLFTLYPFTVFFSDKSVTTERELFDHGREIDQGLKGVVAK